MNKIRFDEIVSTADAPPADIPDEIIFMMDELLERIEDLEIALDTYGSHDDECLLPGSGKCTCGLEEAKFLLDDEE